MLTCCSAGSPRRVVLGDIHAPVVSRRGLRAVLPPPVDRQQQDIQSERLRRIQDFALEEFQRFGVVLHPPRWRSVRIARIIPVADTFPPTKQRPALLAFAEAACTRASALRRDECGDWAIWGDNGHVYAVPEGFQLMIGCDFDNTRWSSGRGWESAKNRLSFGKVTQDGDAEGSIILSGLPTKSEAKEIRAVLGIPKRVELSEEQLAALKAHGATSRFRAVLPASKENPERGRRTPTAEPILASLGAPDAV